MLAELRPGEVVLDLGSGGGIDVLLSARRVGPAGKAYGVDMTDEMLELARRNQREMGVMNAEFLKGEIEDLPLPDASVDVVISNCVINLSTDKARVLQEAYRVIRPGGRFAVADILVQGRLPDALKSDMEAWSGCLAGALHEDDYRALLAVAGFIEADVEIVRTFAPRELAGFGASADLPADVDFGRFCSAFVRARKPR
jgi:ubiquinone/menaquinone biosynthesis C-methylase UbiE